jgi:hypothetical protein
MIIWRIGKLGSLGVAVTIAASALPAAAQQMGHDPYTGPARSASMAAQFDFQQRMQASGAGNSAAALGALQQYVTTYSSNSTSIGNMSQVNQNLSGGSSASIGTSAQDSNGNQGSTSQTDTKIGNKVQVLESLAGSTSSPR